MRLIRFIALMLVGAAAGRTIASAAKSKRPAEPSHKQEPENRLIRTFTVVNRYVEWQKLPTPIALLNLLAFRMQLRQENLHDTTPAPSSQTATTPRPEPHHLYWRHVDGLYNDLKSPRMGSTGVRFGRNVPIEHTFPEPEPALLSPSPRLVSRKLMTRDTFK